VSGFLRPNRASKNNPDATHAPHKRHRQLETIGLIVIAILILAITIFRYWHNINWSAR
jgi:hypothetical protein